MKLSTLLLSSAAVLVAGTAFAADLPSKKAAPAQYVKVCDSFGAGYFTIPGGDTCLKISGFGRAQVDFAEGDRKTSPTSWSGKLRVNFDARSNTELGVLRSFARVEGGNGDVTKAKYGYVQIGGFTAGYTDTAFAGYNGDNTVSIGTDDGAVLGALQYTASLGGSTSLTVAIEDASARTQSKLGDFFGALKDTPITGVGASQIPDLVAAVSTTQGPATIKLSAATHQNYATTSGGGSGQGYAVQAYVKVDASSATTLYAQDTYVKGASSYLGASGIPDYKPGVSSPAQDADTNDQSSGWNVVGAAAQTVGKGTLNVIGRYTSFDFGFVDATVKETAFETNFAYSPVKNLTITPAVAYVRDEVNAYGLNATNDKTTGLLRIQRDF